MKKSVFILSIHALCAIVLLVAQGLCAEVHATFTATVGAESDFPVALQGDSVEFWLEDIEIEVTGLPDNEYCIANVENINYSWQVNENVYGSGSQATVNSAAPGGTHTGHDTLETLGVHKISFTGSGTVDVFYEANAGLVHLEVPVCLYAEANFGIAKLILVTPHGDPINQPYAATGPYDGVPTCNEFSFDNSLPNGVWAYGSWRRYNLLKYASISMWEMSASPLTASETLLLHTAQADGVPSLTLSGGDIFYAMLRS